MVTTQQKKFIDLLEEIFQFDQADLDFGIYRIMNQKREEVTNFLNNELIPQVKKAFDKYKNADVESVKQQIEELEQKLKEMGVAKESSEKYLTLKESMNKGIDISALENEVFSDLTNFFRRYYYEGDFLSLRRYKKDIYAIPYEGEEVKFHWANADQYYVKTSEYFRNYTFILPSGKKVHFKLIEANTEQNNNKEQKDKERRFILFEDEPVKEINGELYIHFEFRPVEGKQTQKKLNERTLEYLSSLTVYSNWLQELFTLSPTEKNNKRTLLEKCLNDYTARNTFDYFIHKDLGNFLRKELDFFIKNEIMHLDDIDTEHEKYFEQYLLKLKVIKSIGKRIINFIEQIENFQKKLWLKKKFIVETNYCITLDNIPEELHKEIINNKKQVNEWKKLFAIHELDEYSEPLTLDFIKNNSFLVLDTKFFSNNFKDKLLQSINDIDDKIDGLLIQSENFQALNLLGNRYKGEVENIYIDPPYNAKSSEILYKNSFKHSSWLSMMNDRILLGKQLLSKDGCMVVAIDENEQERLGILLGDIFPNYDKSTISVVHNPAGVQGKNFSYSHEYSIFIFPQGGEYIGYTTREDDLVSPLRDWGGTSARNLAKNCFYPIIVNPNNNKIMGYGDVCEDDFHPGTSNVKKDNSIYIYPVDKNGVERKWVFGRNSVEKNSNQLYVKKQDDEYVIMRRKSFRKHRTVWDDKRYYANIYGSKMLTNLFGDLPFSFPKSVYTVQDSIKAITSTNKDGALIMDFFAGSGTTGHAVININREDDEGKKRKYVLVEMGEYFDSVTKPRIQKVIYSEDWKNGKPVSRKGSSHVFKYIKLESYEDSLNNIILNRSTQQQNAMDEIMSKEAREEYLLSYMLDVETEGSPSLLNIEKFNNPFEYKMLIAEGQETRPTNIDLVDTFNYLIGLHVKTIDIIKGIKVINGSLSNGEKVLILWRNTDEVSNEQLEDFFNKQGYNTRDSELDRIYVNGDNHLENLKLAEEQWKVVLIEEEFKRLMFEVRDV